MRKFITQWGIPTIAFLLPWQTRWIFGAAHIGEEITQFGIYSLFVVEVLVIIAFALLFPLKIKKTYHPALWLAGLILVVSMFSSGVAIDGQLAMITWIHLAIAMGFFCLLLDERVSLHRVFKGFVLGLVVPALIGIWQFFVGSSEASTLLGMASRDAARLGDSVLEYYGVRMLRAYGSFPHPNIFGGYLAVAIAGILGFWDRLKTPSTIVLAGIAGFILSFGFVLTFSRSAWLGLALGLLLGTIVLVVKNTARARMLVIPLAILFIGAAVFIGTGRFGLQSTIESRSITERIEQYEVFPQVVGSHWLVGRGLGNYTLVVAETMPGNAWWQYQPIHNVPLLIVGEIGLIGLLAVILWAASMDAINFRRMFGSPLLQGGGRGGLQEGLRRDAVTAFMMGNTILVVAFFDHYLWSTWSGLALAALVMAATARLGEE